METQTFTASISREDGSFIPQCLEVDVASQGESEEEALVNLEKLWNYTLSHLNQMRNQYSEDLKSALAPLKPLSGLFHTAISR